MNRNDNPLFALAPPEVLAKAQALAEEFRRDYLIRDWIGRHLLLTTLIGLAALAGNVVNAYSFWGNLGPMAHGISVWMDRSFALCVIAIGLGGSACTFNAYVTWIEFITLKKARGDAAPADVPEPVWSRGTWLPLIPLALIPALINALFSLRFFLALVAVALLLWLIALRARTLTGN